MDAMPNVKITLILPKHWYGDKLVKQFSAHFKFNIYPDILQIGLRDINTPATLAPPERQLGGGGGRIFI